jgi:hypothetical protein
MTARPRQYENELVVSVAEDEVSRVTKTLAEAGMYLSGLRFERATLEQAFLNLTGGPPPPNPNLQPVGASADANGPVASNGDALSGISPEGGQS